MGIEVGVSKQRRSDIQIMSNQIGDATRQHELAIENYRIVWYLPKGTYQWYVYLEKPKVTQLNPD
jgi:hypothetical protein